MDRLIGARFVAERKITDYLLNNLHPTGAAKARFFIAFGFDAGTPSDLIEAIAAHPDRNRLVSVKGDGFGIRSVVECGIATPDGRNPCIRTVWMCDHGTTIHRFLTAYPAARHEGSAVEPHPRPHP